MYLAPLYDILQKKNQWHWGTSQETAFKEAKKLLTSNNLLVYSEPNKKELLLACDASPYGPGAVLSHRVTDGTEHPIPFAF